MTPSVNTTTEIGWTRHEPRARPESGSAAPGRRDWAWLIALWVVVTAYNLFKPFHLDDTAHLEIARWISDHPLHPMSGMLNWYGIDEPIHRTNQPHLYFYLLALWGRAFGYSEPAMHALQSLTALAAILLFYRLARRLIGRSASGHTALWATALLALGPAFVVEQNLMVDVPLLSTWLLFFNALICDVDSPRQHRRYAVAALACTAALLIKYSSLPLLLILWISLAAERRWRQAWTALVPLAALAAWSLFNVWDYGGVHIAARPVGRAHPWLWLMDEAIAWVLAVGGLTPLGLIAAVQSRRAFARAGAVVYLIAAAALVALAVAVALGLASDYRSDQLLWLAFACNAELICLALIPEALDLLSLKLWRREVALRAAPAIYLFLWVVGTSAFFVLFAPFIAARHVLLILPALTILLIARCPVALTRASKVFGLAFTIAVSAGLCLSDWRFAAFYQQEAASLAGSLPKAGAIWASGHWGWQWYTARAGIPQVDIRSSVLRPGDYLAVAREVNHQELETQVPLRLVRTDTQSGPLLSLLCTGRIDRLYESTVLFGPWSISRRCLNRVTIYQVEGGG